MYELVYDYKNLYDAYLKARKQKRYRRDVLQFSYTLEENLIELQNELIWKTYKVGPYHPFVIYEPKKRQIFALPFRDRVVQHALNAVIEPIFERCMIYDSYACRRGKGTHQAARRMAYFLGKSNNYYYLKADIKAYFSSINRTILRTIIARKINDENILWLIDEILNSTPDSGLPIGNLMSQLFANVYLHELDHYIKNVCGVKFYIRYMDDFIILHNNKAYLCGLLSKIKSFLRTQLALELNDKTKVGKTSNGIEFVGYRIWSRNKLIKKQSLSRMRKKARAWRHGKISDERFLSSLGSWLGHAADTASHQAVERILLDNLRFAIYTKKQLKTQ
ncbi:reverse transcriptase/maturase family protein [Gracilinema caldarium]|uniref:reverse transcriptase/maturase family protein n=1 Tax=Gracilinema caldarium TaxID=215591 RepID=UPI0026EBA7AB|nr:reverse transcriptase/maturase family protein [Gracilinema caldarium]